MIFQGVMRSYGRYIVTLYIVAAQKVPILPARLLDNVRRHIGGKYKFYSRFTTRSHNSFKIIYSFSVGVLQQINHVISI